LSQFHAEEICACTALWQFPEGTCFNQQQAREDGCYDSLSLVFSFRARQIELFEQALFVIQADYYFYAWILIQFLGQQPNLVFINEFFV
jgi:hypothetical protein